MSPLVIVTGASSNHFRCLNNLLHTIDVFEPESRVFVYDLGLTGAERRQLRDQGRELRRFPFEQYPPHLDLRNNFGHYAWKPVIIADVLKETGGRVLWLDAGNLLESPLTAIKQALADQGIVSPISLGSLARWTHPGTLRYLRVPHSWYHRPNRKGGIVGFNARFPSARELVRRWRQYALIPKCIGPAGSNRSNHRQDQSILSVLVYRAQQRYRFKLEDRWPGISTHNDDLTPAHVRKRVRRILQHPPPPPRLEHLVLVPLGGLCTRLCAIASARRLCQRLKARLSVAWEWGDFREFFAPLSDVEIVAPGSAARETQIRRNSGPAAPTRVVDIRVKCTTLRTRNIFWGSDESRIGLPALADYLPRLNLRLRKSVAQFAASAGLADAIGVHVRRTNKAARVSPDQLFFRCLDDLIANGKRIFLSTDNLATERKMKRRYGRAIVTFPKATRLEARWPRADFNRAALEEDLIDLFLLAETRYVIGSYGSSFTEVAIGLNGSWESGILMYDVKSKP